MKKALVIVDFQNDFIDGTLGFEKAKTLKNKILTLAQGFEGDLIFTFDTHGESYLATKEGKNLPIKHCKKGDFGYQMPKEFAPFLEKGVKICEIKKQNLDKDCGLNLEEICENLSENSSLNLGENSSLNLGENVKKQNSSENSSLNLSKNAQIYENLNQNLSKNSANKAQISSKNSANKAQNPSQSVFIFEKASFGSLELALFLRAKGYEMIEFCGLVSHICVFQNIILAFNANLNTQLILHENATASFDENLHEKALDLLRAFWVKIV